MAKRKLTSSPSTTRNRRPATTPEARENQLIALAIDLVEQRLIDGSASSQETTHFLKLASTRAKLEKKLLETDIELKSAKKKQIENEERREELFKEAIDAMKRYSGNGDRDDD